MPDSAQHYSPEILVADDDVHFASMVKRVLGEHGYCCETAANGDVAAEWLARRHFDALLADINMPGNHQLQLLRANRGLVPIVLVTGLPTVETAVGALRQSAVDYLVKPVDTDLLLAAVRSAVEKGHAMRSLRDAKDDVARQVRNLAHVDRLLELPGSANRAPAAPSLERFGKRAETLTPREREITLGRARGQTVAALAASLGISEHTVRNHFKSVFRKLGVHSQEELVSRLNG